MPVGDSESELAATHGVVAVTCDGAKFIGIELRDDWKSELRGRSLGGLITTAIRAELISPAPRPVKKMVPPVASTELLRLRLERIRELDRKATQALTALVEWLSQDDSQNERRESSSGRVTVWLRNCAFSQVTVDEVWAQQVVKSVLVADVNEALSGVSRSPRLPSNVQREVDEMHRIEADLAAIGGELR